MKLFDNWNLDRFSLDHRVVLAPLTRCRAILPDYIPNVKLASQYYCQRAGKNGEGCLLISEGVCPSSQGRGSHRTPGIYTEEQRAAWSHITKAVHDSNPKAFFFIQLWHVGRASHVSYQAEGDSPISSIPIAISSNGIFQCSTESGLKPFSKPREISDQEIESHLIPQYVHSARLAKEAGFDGVEIHSANGYLLQQFLEDGPLLQSGIAKDDERKYYGSSIQTRCRLLVSVLKKVIEVWGPGKVGVRLSPFSSNNDIHDSDPLSLYTYLLKEELDHLPLAYVHLVEPRVIGSRDASAFHPGEGSEKCKSNPFGVEDSFFTENRKEGLLERIMAVYEKEKARGRDPILEGDEKNGKWILSNAVLFREATRHPLIIAGGMTRKSAIEILEKKWADAVAFGRYFISNPDLPDRLKNDWPLTPYDRSTFYHGEEKGYIDYAKFSNKL